MHKSLSKNDKQNFLENTSKSNEPNLEKLTRKMEQFEKILTQVKIIIFLLTKIFYLLTSWMKKFQFSSQNPRKNHKIHFMIEISG